MDPTQDTVDPTGATIPIEDRPQDRFWTHPTTGEVFTRVTTALQAVAKDALVPWAAGLSVKAVYADLPRVAASYLRKPCGRTYTSKVRCKHEKEVTCVECACAVCRECTTDWLALRHFAESSRRAQEGTDVHETITAWTRDSYYPGYLDHLKPYIDGFMQFVEDYGLEHTDFETMSARIINRTHMYTGTFDGDLRLHADRSEAAAEMCDRLRHPNPLVRIDVKTREKTDGQMFKDHVLQLNGYDRGELLFLQDGSEVQPPQVDALAVLQLSPPTEERPQGYKLQPVKRDDEEFEAFLAALRLFRWQHERGTAAMSMRSFPLSEEFKRERTNRKARERRAAKKAQAAVVECTDPYCAGGDNPCGKTPNQHLEVVGPQATIEADRQAAMARLRDRGNMWPSNGEIAQELAHPGGGSGVPAVDTTEPPAALGTPASPVVSERLRRSVTGQVDPWTVVSSGGGPLKDQEIPF